ncbi:uncharacterized protein [Coffea arabica]|uniref:Uncharacterized protein isoform X1 n=1 Tax=Coffea arabica TaxID=13443 RepID=A0ABM4WX58_COFAR
MMEEIGWKMHKQDNVKEGASSGCADSEFRDTNRPLQNETMEASNSYVHDHITGMAEEIEVQATAPKASSQKVGRIACCWFCHVPRHTKKSCPYWRAQAWRNRMAGVKRRKQTAHRLLDELDGAAQDPLET